MLILRVVMAGVTADLVGGMICACQTQPRDERGMFCTCQTQARDGRLVLVREIAGEYGIRLGTGARTVGDLAVEVAAQVRAQVAASKGETRAGEATKALLTKMRAEARRRYELGAANVANEATVGYRRVDELSMGGAGNERIRRDMSQGTHIRSSRPMDLCINGEGFFRCTTRKQRKKRMYGLG